jgi:hypothetical protein
MQEVRAIKELKVRANERQHGKETSVRCRVKWLKNILEWICVERRKYEHPSTFIIWILICHSVALAARFKLAAMGFIL